MQFFRRLLRQEKSVPKIVRLDSEANTLLLENLRTSQGGIILGYGGPLTALRLINEVAPTRFGVTTTEVPLTKKELQTLIDEKLIDLSEGNLTKLYTAHRGGKEKRY
jgi:hypothetical protein